MKMVNKYYKKKQRKASNGSKRKAPKSFKEEKEKRPKKYQKNAWDRYKNLSKKDIIVNIIEMGIRIFVKKKNKRKLNI